jgi:Family of unknown function (DUF5719)
MSLNGRLLVAVLVAAIVVAAGTFSERVLGTRGLPPPVSTAATSGGWLCPHGGGEGFRAWVVAVNPTGQEADVVLTSYSPDAVSPIRDVLPPRTQRSFQVPAERPASATMLEFFGTSVVASMVTLRGPEEGLAAEPCASAAASRWFVPEGTTVRGQATTIVAMNPFAQEAVLSIALHTGRDVIRHGNLSGVVVEPRTAVSFDLNRFALGEKVVLADVRVALGKVAVAGFGSGTEAGLRGVMGVSEPAATWVLPGAGASQPARVSVLGVDRREAPFQVLDQDADGSRVAIEEQEVAPRQVESLEIPQAAWGIVIGESGVVPFVAGRRLSPAVSEPEEPAGPPAQQGGGGKDDKRDGRGGGGGKRRQEPEPEPPPPTDQAATAGSSHPSAAWVVPSPLPAVGGGSLLVLENPGGATATGQVTLLGEGGPVGSPIPVSVEAGRTIAIDLRDEAGEQPVAVIVRLSSGMVVAAQVASNPGAYAVAVGTPFDVSRTFEGLGI